jgi:hypothetical protein
MTSSTASNGISDSRYGNEAKRGTIDEVIYKNLLSEPRDLANTMCWCKGSPAIRIRWAVRRYRGNELGGPETLVALRTDCPSSAPTQPRLSSHLAALAQVRSGHDQGSSGKQLRQKGNAVPSPESGNKNILVFFLRGLRTGLNFGYVGP